MPTTKEGQKTGKEMMSTSAKVATGFGVAALAAAAAGAVFLYGTDAGKKRRKEISSWMIRMRADIVDKMADMKDWSETSYSDVIDTVANKYKTLKNIDTTELVAVAADLKKHWKTVKSEVEKMGKKKSSK